MRLSFLIILSLLFTSSSGCAAREPKVVEVPANIGRVTDVFLKTMKEGKREQAVALVSSAAKDEFDAQYASDHKLLAAAPKLTPRFVQLPLPSESDSKEANVVYAVKKGEKWTTINIRLYRYRDEPYEIEYWRVTNKFPSPAVKSSAEEKIEEEIKETMVPTMIATSLTLVVLGALGITFLVWLVKRRPHVVSPEVKEQTRRHAVTVRETGDDA